MATQNRPVSGGQTNLSVWSLEPTLDQPILASVSRSRWCAYAQRVRVAIDVTPLAGDQTGIGLFVRELMRFCNGVDDLEVVGLAMTARGRDEISQQLGAGVPLSRPAPARLLRELWQRCALPPVEVLSGPVEVVHGTNYVVPPARNAATLVSVHDLSAWHSDDLVHTSSRIYPQLVRRALDRGSHIHAISQFVADEICEELRVAPERVHVVHLAAPRHTAGDPEAGRSLLGGRPYLLSIGTIEPRKDFPLVIEALANLASSEPELCLAVAGGEGWGTDDFDAAVRKFGLEDRVVKLGYVSDSQKADLLAGAEVLVSAARYEGFGLVPIEAMAAQTPVVAAAGGAVPEVCGDAAQLVPVQDVEALTEAISLVLTNSEHRSGLVAAGLTRCQSFTPERTGKQMVDLYRTLA